MDFTFGIITHSATQHNIDSVISSIKRLNIPNYEIIVVGGNEINIENVIHIPFDESLKSNWITRKKNIICEKAKYDNIVLIHDYIIFNEDWYLGFLKFGNDFDICNSKIIDLNGGRYLDYCIFPCGWTSPFSPKTLIPYDYLPSLKLSKISYIPGYYFIIKKHIALKYPLDERLKWCEAEDLVLSKTLVKNNIVLNFNPYSSIKFLKQKGDYTDESVFTSVELNIFENMTDSEIENIYQAQINEVKREIYSRTSLNIDL